MVKPVELFPSRRGVARLASSNCPVRALRLHALAELPSVGILVACRAGPVLEPIFHGCRRSLRNRFVAVRAQDSHVRPAQREPRLLVSGQGKMRRLESFNVMALFTTILVRCARELAFVNVLMTVLALRLSNLENRISALGQVAFLALHFGMASFQGI